MQVRGRLAIGQHQSLVDPDWLPSHWLLRLTSTVPIGLSPQDAYWLIQGTVESRRVIDTHNNR